MRRRTLMILCFLSTLMFAPGAEAALILHLNTANKTFALTGSDTGTLAPGGGGGRVVFSDNIGGPGEDDISLFTGVAFTTSNGTPGRPATGNDLVLGFGAGHVFLRMFTSMDGLATLTGTGIFQSYLDITGEPRTKLESTVGRTLALNDPSGLPSGTGFDPIQVRSVAIPEPSSFVLLGLALPGWFLRRRRMIAR